MTIATTTPVPGQHRSLFDSLKREDESGEYWSARDLMPLYGYRTWHGFIRIVDQAKLACATSAHDVASNFTGTWKIDIHRHKRQDYRVTRYAAYLIAMEGDPSKTEIAEAKTYFAVQTRRAEVMLDGLDADLELGVQRIREIQQLRNEQRALSLRQGLQEDRLNDHGRQLTATKAQIEATNRELDEARAELIERRRQLDDAARQVVELAERVRDVETVTPLKDSTHEHTMKEAGQLLGYGQNEFHAVCRDLGVIYRDPAGGHKMYQVYIDQGWGVARWLEWANGRGHSWAVLVTGKGVIKIKRKIDETRGIS